MSESVRILIVEDLATDADLAKREIHKVIKDCEFQCVETRKAFLEALETFQPDLILSDYHLPSFNGKTALSLALERAPLTPLIIWTGSLSEDIAVECMKAGANNYIIKENIVRLGPAVIHALEERQLLLERKQAKEALERSERRFRALIENGLDSISLLAVDGSLLWESPAVFRILDYSPDQFLGQDIFKLMHPDDLDWTSKLFADITQEPGSRRRGEFRLRHSTGTWRWVEAVVTNLLDEPSVNAIVVNYRDVTGRKQAEELLRRNEMILAQAEKMAHLGAWEIEYSNRDDLYDSSLHWSEEVYRIFGYEPGAVEVTNHLFFQHVHPDDRQKVAEAVNRAIAQKSSYEIDHRVIRPDGTERIVLEHAHITFNKDGQPLRMLGAIQDITDRKQAEESLKDERNLLRTLIDNLPDRIYVMDTQGRKTLSNTADWRASGGKTMQDVIGKTDFDMYPPELAEEFWQLDKAVLDSGIPIINHEEPGLDFEGNPVWILATKIPLRDTDGKIVGLVGIGRDITERKEGEARIDDLLVFNEKILNNSPIGILTYKLTGECVFANENAALMVGAQVKQLKGQNFHSIESWRESGLHDLVQRAISTQTAVTSDIHMITTFGKDIWMTVHCVTFTSKEEDHILLTLSDISERKQAETGRQALLEIMQGLDDRSDLQGFLRLIHDSIGRVIYAENFFVVLYDEKSGLFEEIYSVDKYDLPEPPSKLERSITSYVFRTSKPLLVTDVLFHEMAAQGEVELVGTDSASWLGVPLKAAGRTIGVIAVQDYENPNRYSERDQEFLASIAAQVALAIERKRAEETLRKERERAQEYLDVAGVLMLALDRNGVVTLINQKGCEILGFSYDEIIGRDWIHTFLPPAIRNEMKEAFQNLIAGNSQALGYYENSVLTKNGGERMIAWHNTVIRDSHGAIISSLSSGEDITERKLAEAELRASEERFVQLANNIQEVFWMTDAETGKELYMSPAAEEIWGRPIEDLMNEPDAFIQSVLPEDLPLLKHALEKEKSGERAEVEYRIMRPDTSIRWIWDRAFPILDDTGKVKRIAGVSADVTARKKADEQLRKLSRAVEQSASTIVITDVAGNIEYINPKFTETTGYTFEEVVGQNPRILKSGDTSLEEYEQLWSTIKSGEEWRGELHNKKKNGELYWEHVTISPMSNERGEITHFIAVKEEITQRKQAEEEIRRRAEETSALLATSLALTNLDLKATLQTIGSSARTLFAGDGCRIFLLEPDGESLRCVLALKESSAAFSDLRIKIGDGVTGTVAASGQAEIVNEMQNDPRGVQVAGTPVEEEAIMFAPLKERDSTIGVLSIRRAGAERPFQSDDLELLEAFAAMAASAVSKARLFEETERRLAELEALYENGLAVGRLLKPSEIGDRIIETFARYLSWHHVAIRLKRPESDQLELIAFNQAGLNEQERLATEHHFNSMITTVDQGLSGLVMQTGQAIRTGNVHSHPQYVDTQEGIQSGLYMPLKIGDRIIGSISVEAETANAFTAQDERLLATLSNQAAIAFENARLYQSAQQELVERKRLQERLDREHAQLKTLFETIPDPIWLKDPEGKYLACNPVLEKLIEIPEVQILGKTDYVLLDEKLAGHFKAKDQEAIHRNTPMKYQEWVTYPNKQPRLMETVRTPMHDEQGSLIGVLGISHDVTAMHNTEQELRESQELYRLLVETSPDGIGILGLDGTIIFANQQLADLFGMKNTSDCIGTNFLSFIAPGERLRMMELKEEAMLDGVMLEEYWMVRKDGSRFYGEARSSLSLDKADRPRWIIGQIRDITESKTAHETIQEERQRFLDLFENTPVAIWLEDFSGVMAWMEQLRIKGITDLKDYLIRHPDQLKFALGLIRILSVNQAAVEMNGANSKAHLLEKFGEMIRDEAPSNAMLHELEMLWNGKTSFEFEVTSQRLDHRLTTGILHVFIPTNNAEPDYGRVIIASTDISERVNTEKALQASETHYRELADSITDVFFEMDSNLRYIYWNKASEILTGIMAEDAIGKSMPEIFGETKEQTKIEKIYEDVLRSQQSKTFETTLTLENREHIFEINAYPSTRGVSVVAKEVTDRKRSETIMQKRVELMDYSAKHTLNEVMQKAIDEVSQLTGSTIGFLHFVEADQITLGMQTWSTSALQQFNVPVSAGAHLPVDQAGVWADAVRERRPIIHNEYASLPNKKGLPEGHAPVIREMIIPIIRNEKTVAVLGLGNRPKDYTQRDLAIAERFADYAWDITERKQMEIALADERNQLAKRVEERAADLIRANTNLARALRVKDEFLANMSHELRTPLNAILGLSESLGEQIAGPLNEKQQKYITTISESGRHLLALINDILDLAKIEAGQITLDINRVDIQSVCEASLRMIRQLAQKKRQDVALVIDDDIGLIWADERRLKQMIVNLLSNAVKFTAEDGKIGLEVHGNRAENEVMITVWDNGIGMREEDLSRLFQPFVQLDSGLARETTGTGLGLALVAQMVRLHGGSVRVASHPEQGSHFTIVLPWEPALAADPTNKMKITGKFRAIRPDPNNRPTILLIEDTNEVIMMIKDYLELAGYEVATAQDGVEGITQAQLIHPDLILMDVMMPRMDGLEATRRLRSEPDFEETPIIALTALAMPSDRERCINAGMNDYMSKPVNLKELVKTIQRFLVNIEEANS